MFFDLSTKRLWKSNLRAKTTYHHSKVLLILWHAKLLRSERSAGSEMASGDVVQLSTGFEKETSNSSPCCETGAGAAAIGTQMSRLRPNFQTLRTDCSVNARCSLPWNPWSMACSRTTRAAVTNDFHNSVTSHTQISDLFVGLILQSHPIGSKSKCNRVSQPLTSESKEVSFKEVVTVNHIGLWPRCLRTSKFLLISSVHLPRNCMHRRMFSHSEALFKNDCTSTAYWYMLQHHEHKHENLELWRLKLPVAKRMIRTTAITVHKRRKKKRKKLRRSGHCHCSTDRSIQNEMCSC